MSGLYNLGEDIASSVIHGIGFLLAIAGLILLTTFAVTGGGDARHIVSVSIFGASLVLLYGASTLYHSIQLPRAQKVLQNIDHAAIFLLIAGSYTPFTLVSLRGSWGWSIFGVIWGLALLGIAFQYSHLHRMEVARVTLYVLMGWIVMVAIKPLINAIEPWGVALIFLGGAAYMLGVVFYTWEKLPYNHAIWHGCVLAGSVCHFFAVLWYLTPVGA